MTWYYSSILSACSILFLIFGMFLSIKNYKFRFKSDYSIRNMFPYEFNYESHFVDNLGGNALLVLASLFSLTFYGTFPSSHSEGFSTFVLICGIFAAVFAIMLYFIPTKYLKLHIAALAFDAVFTFMLSGAIFCLNLKYYRELHNALNIVALVLAALSGLLILILTLSPGFSFRIKGVESKDENGNLIYVRPKTIFIALTEWLIIFVSFFNQIIVILFAITIK